MEIQDLWLEFEPTDRRTHPESLAHVQVELADGRKFSCWYADAGWFFKNGAPIPESTAGRKLRWRYIKD
jgi:hypothetical protein